MTNIQKCSEGIEPWRYANIHWYMRVKCIWVNVGPKIFPTGFAGQPPLISRHATLNFDSCDHRQLFPRQYCAHDIYDQRQLWPPPVDQLWPAAASGSCDQRPLWPAAVVTSGSCDQRPLWPAAVVTGGSGDWRRQWWPAAVVTGGSDDRRQWWPAAVVATDNCGHRQLWPPTIVATDNCGRRQTVVIMTDVTIQVRFSRLFTRN